MNLIYFLATYILIHNKIIHSQLNCVSDILLNCVAGLDGDYKDIADHPDEGKQIRASVSLLLALSMLDG